MFEVIWMFEGCIKFYVDLRLLLGFVWIEGLVTLQYFV